MRQTDESPSRDYSINQSKTRKPAMLTGQYTKAPLSTCLSELRGTQPHAGPLGAPYHQDCTRPHNTIQHEVAARCNGVQTRGLKRIGALKETTETWVEENHLG